ncbi:protease complex subunit PrcB family protein [Salinibius halmophilus]|uniref:protease complex subunit PrcB family protein n=1 Tax=Salinibius halmophilus TaxID=1853216 RepID=UPI0013142AF4|nr:protease complex subunit PrcB family protein [Salinibius halmophilus]
MSLFHYSGDTFRVLDEGLNCTVYEPTAELVSHAESGDNEQAIIIAMGERSSGGYYFQVQTNNAELAGTTIKLDITQVAPEPGMITTSALTSPCITVAVPKAWQTAESVAINNAEFSIAR